MQRLGTAVYPYYLFYNPDYDAASHRNRGTSIIGGVQIIDGFLTASYIASNTSGGKMPLAAKRCTALEPMMFPLEDLLCTKSEYVPDPEEIAATVEWFYKQKDSSLMLPRKVRRIRPVLGKQLPPSIRELVETRGGLFESLQDSIEEPNLRTTIVFVSE